jgi:hypothetical protein
MKGFFDKLLKGDNGNKNNNSNKPGSRGGGQSLGGSKPGKVIQVELSQPGPLGMKVGGDDEPKMTNKRTTNVDFIREPFDIISPFLTTSLPIVLVGMLLVSLMSLKYIKYL